MRVLRRESDRDADAVDTVETDADGDVVVEKKKPVWKRFERPEKVDTGKVDVDDDKAVVTDRPERPNRPFRRERLAPAPTAPVAPVAPPTQAEPEVVRTEREIVVEQWSFADAVIAIIGAGMALIGALVLVRTGVDGSWFRPLEEVADATHTPLLGALELGAGVVLMLTAAARSRALPALAGLAIAVLAAMAAIENAEVARELAIEESWAWMLAGTGLLVSIVSLVPPRRRRVERLVES